jgi:hypothetical protein
MMTVPDKWLAPSLQRKTAKGTMSSGWPTPPPGYRDATVAMGDGPASSRRC